MSRRGVAPVGRAGGCASARPRGRRSTGTPPAARRLRRTSAVAACRTRPPLPAGARRRARRAPSAAGRPARRATRNPHAPSGPDAVAGALAGWSACRPAALRPSCSAAPSSSRHGSRGAGARAGRWGLRPRRGRRALGRGRARWAAAAPAWDAGLRTPGARGCSPRCPCSTRGRRESSPSPGGGHAVVAPRRPARCRQSAPRSAVCHIGKRTCHLRMWIGGWQATDRRRSGDGTVRVRRGRRRGWRRRPEVVRSHCCARGGWCSSSTPADRATPPPPASTTC